MVAAPYQPGEGNSGSGLEFPRQAVPDALVVPPPGAAALNFAPVSADDYPTLDFEADEIAVGDGGPVVHAGLPGEDRPDERVALFEDPSAPGLSLKRLVLGGLSGVWARLRPRHAELPLVGEDGLITPDSPWEPPQSFEEPKDDVVETIIHPAKRSKRPSRLDYLLGVAAGVMIGVDLLMQDVATAEIQAKVPGFLGALAVMGGLAFEQYVLANFTNEIDLFSKQALALDRTAKNVLLRRAQNVLNGIKKPFEWVGSLGEKAGNKIKGDGNNPVRKFAGQQVVDSSVAATLGAPLAVATEQATEQRKGLEKRHLSQKWLGKAAVAFALLWEPSYRLFRGVKDLCYMTLDMTTHLAEQTHIRLLAAIYRDYDTGEHVAFSKAGLELEPTKYGWAPALAVSLGVAVSAAYTVYQKRHSRLSVETGTPQDSEAADT